MTRESKREAVSLTAEELREAFGRAPALTVGLEEEVMLLDPSSLELVPCAPQVLDRLDGDPGFKLELPASQLEIVTTPAPDLATAVAELAAARERLARAALGLARPAAAGAHPFSAPEGALNADERYVRLEGEYGALARRQLVCAMQVHVALGDADAALAVHDALRSYLPEIAALAAAAPFHAGADTGLASVRPTISQLLPRQGVPPALASWDRLAAELAWGAAAGAVPEPRSWWWELRPNPVYGTLEVRVPDAQATVADAAGVAALVQSLVAWLLDRHHERALPPPAETWRIAENRSAACRNGVEGSLADLETGERVTTRERLRGLIEELEPTAERLGCAAGLAEARGLVEENGAMRQRRVGREEGPLGLARWLADRFVPADGSQGGHAGGSSRAGRPEK